MDKSSEELFLEGYNCAQSVFAAHAGKFGMDDETALKISAPLGGGVGRMREVCGAFTACAMLCGLKYADTSANPKNKGEIYRLTQQLAEKFKQRNGSIICRGLLNLQKDALTPFAPADRDAKYYAERPCLKIIWEASRIVENDILNGDKK